MTESCKVNDVFNREQSRAVDRAATERYGIPGIVLMENASREVARIARDMLPADPQHPTLIVCGGGNNGGDGYAAARHLHNAGIEIVLLRLAEPHADPKGDAKINHNICQSMMIPMISFDEIDHAGPFDLTIDAVFGTGLDRPIAGEKRKVIQWMNAQSSPILAVDIPSGLDCNTGEALGIAVRASKTVTFLGWKWGFLSESAALYIGEVEVAQIGAPRELLKEFGEPMSGFST